MSHLEYYKKTNRIFSELECHFHGVYEIYYFVSGDAEIMVDGKIYKLSPHSLILLAPNVYHGIQVNSVADYIRYVLFVTPNDISPERMQILTNIMPNHKKNPGQEIFFENIEAFHLEHFFWNLKQLETQPNELKETMEPIFVEALLAQINLIYATQKPSSVQYHTPSKIMDIINYINSHLSDPLSLDIVADHFFISKNYLNKNFKQYLGTTVAEYIRFKRVILAKQFMNNGESAMDAAMQAGFSDYSTFYRSYVKFMKTAPKNASPKQ